MDVYTSDGNIIRQFPKEDGTTEVQLEFLFDDLFWSRLFAVAAFYVAFHDRLGIDYVLANHSATKAVVRQADFGDAAQDELIATVVKVKDNANLLLGTAEKHLFGLPPEAVETNSLPILEQYKVTEATGRSFLEHFSAALE